MHLLIATILAAAPVSPPFDEVLAEASLAGTPIVLDVFTTWCKPCRTMNERVFPNRKVAKALEGLRFAKYDAERGAGVEVARRFDVNSFPTVLLLTPDGHVVERIRSQDVEGFVRELEAARPLATVRVRGEPADDASAAVWLIAARSVAKRDPARALRWLQRAQAADAGNSEGIASRAAAEAVSLQAGAEADAATARAIIPFLEAWPGSSEAPGHLHRLAVLTKRRGLDEALVKHARERVVKAWAESSDAERLNDLVYLLLELGELGGAARLAARLEQLAPGDASFLDTAAEVAFQAGDRERAVTLSRKAVSLAPGDEALAKNLARFAKDEPELPPLSAPDDFDDDHPSLATRHFLDARAAGLQLKDACPATLTADVVVRLYLAGNKVARAAAFEPRAPATLLRCLEKAALALERETFAQDQSADVYVRYGKRLSAR